MAVADRPSVNHYASATPQERDAVELVAAHVEAWERGMARDFKERCDRFYMLYRGFKRFRDAWIRSGPNDRDAILYDEKKHWGAHLHIPLSFRTVERMVPEAIAHRPRMLYLPRHPRWEENVANVRMLIDSQQDQIDIDLAFQDVMRSGMIYGLGIGKTFWRKEYTHSRGIQRRTLRLPGQDPYVLGGLKPVCTFDDPDFEAVDIYDFMWDPYGSDMRTCSWVVHRLWMSLEDCLDRISTGAWNTASAQSLTEDVIRSKGNGQKYDEIWMQRMEASGFGSLNHAARGEQIHEVWEWHDGERVLTVLDRSILVQAAENPCVGRIPFHVYRPVPLQGQMVGIGVIEPIQHLNRELDTLRSQRRDAATMVLAAGWVYDDAAIEEDDLAFGPAAAIRVSNSARVQDAIMKIPTGDIPGSGYQEEAAILRDIDTVTGISDGDQSGMGTASTATEAQLIQATLSKRIQLQSRRFEIEVVRGAAKDFLGLNQRMILNDRAPIRMPDHGLDLAQAAQEGRWRWFDIGPGELQGEFEIIPDGGSMAARNVPQDRQDAVQMMQLFGDNPFVDSRRPLVEALKLFGIRDPEAWLKQAPTPVPPAALQILQQAGVDPNLLQFAVSRAQAQDPQLAAQAQQGPGSAAVANMMNGSG